MRMFSCSPIVTVILYRNESMPHQEFPSSPNTAPEIHWSFHSNPPGRQIFPVHAHRKQWNVISQNAGGKGERLAKEKKSPGTWRRLAFRPVQCRRLYVIPPIYNAGRTNVYVLQRNPRKKGLAGHHRPLDKSSRKQGGRERETERCSFVYVQASSLPRRAPRVCLDKFVLHETTCVYEW